MRVVFDTNAVVSGVLRPSSIPARLLYLVGEARIRPAVDWRIIAEYREVLARPRLKIPAVSAAELVRRFAELAEHVTVPAAVKSRLDRLALRDRDDQPFMEVALSGMVDAIVTGNATHFPRSALEPVRVLTPRELLVEVETRD